MKFYKIIEIAEEEYIEATGDTQYEECCQCCSRQGENVYVAIEEDMYSLEIDMDILTGEQEEQIAPICTLSLCFDDEVQDEQTN